MKRVPLPLPFRFALAVLVASSAACAPLPMPARTTLARQPVTVTTKEGVIRGHVRDARVVGDEIVIVTPNGERRIAWTDITGLGLDVTPRAEPGAPGGDRFSNPADREVARRESDEAARRRAKAAWLDAAPDTRRVRIALTGDDETLSRIRYGGLVGRPGASVWSDYQFARRERICSGPCEVTIDVHPSDAFRIGVHDIELPPDEPDVQIDVRRGDSLVVPAILLGLGALAVPLGAGLTAYGVRNDRRDFAKAGVVSAAGGAVLATAGIVWLAFTKPRSIRVSRAPLGVVRF